LSEGSSLRFMNDSTNAGINSKDEFINWVASGIDYQNYAEAKDWVIGALEGGTE